MQKWGEPRPLMAPTTAVPIAQTEESAGPIRLEIVEIQNFRAYRKPQAFALGADVTVFYGPNGFGKTSLFDAIDFAATGGVGRLKSRPQANWAKTLQHLDSGSGDSKVSLSVRRDGVVRRIVRSVADPKRALLDGRPTDRKAVLAELTGGAIPATDRVENFVSLFRASHLFSQELQELTKDFREDCCVSAEIVSRMLAFEDYANAMAKTTKVRDVLQEAISETRREISGLTEQIAADTKELERLGQAAKAHTDVRALAAEVDALRTKLEAVGIALTTGKPDATLMRGWRAALESRYLQCQAAGERLSILAREVAGLPGTRVDLAAAQEELAQKEQALRAVDEQRTAAELAVQRAEQRLAEMTGRQVEAQNRADALEWVRNTQPVYGRLIAQSRELGVETQLATAALAQLRAAEGEAVEELGLREAAAAQVAERLKARRAELVVVQALLDAIPGWQADRTRLAMVLQSERAQLRAFESLRAEERELAPQIATVVADEQRLVRHISEADRNQSELRALVSRLQGYVHTGTCPLCGEDHGSKQQLLQRIRTHVGADTASGARLDLTRVRESAKHLTELVAANKQKQAAAEHQLAALTKERVTLEKEIAGFVATASELDVSVEPAGPTPTEQVQALAARLQQEVTELGKRMKVAATAAETARTAVANAKNAVTARKTEADAKTAALARMHEEINRLRSDPRLTQVSLDIEPSELTELAQRNSEQLERFKAEAAKAAADVNEKKPERGVLRQKATSSKVQLAALRTQVGSLRNSVMHVTAKLDASKLPADSTGDSLLVLIGEQSRLQAQFAALRDVASSLELAMDAATTAAALTTLQQTVRNREEARARATDKRDRHLPWLDYFDGISRLVSTQQNEAIASFTHKYGPRTSVIQRRLRSVYGFDDIEMRSRESTISVRVKRHGEELRPTDYFSQSQQQTLLLGLFLTACSSQTWSAFSPVLLDDPVTHFDDLNTYAFLDLLVGFLEAEVEKRQFIISTCDEKLFQLARQKFRHLGARAKFYRFTAMGASGPIVEESS